MINKKIQKIISVGIIATTMLIPTMANAEWKQDSVGWWYTEGNSYIQNGWKLINNNWYYFDNNGYMKTGWIQDTSGKWYYLSSQGNMLSNTVTPDGYTLNTDGSWNVSVQKTESKQMASAPTVAISDSSINEAKKDTTQQNEENNNTSTKKKKKSSSSSSSSSNSSSSNNNSNIIFPIDDGKEQLNDYKNYTTDEKGMCVMNLLYNPNNLRIEIMGTGLGSSQQGLYVLHFDVRDYGYKNYESMDLINIINTTKLKNENGKVTIEYMIRGNDEIDWDKYKDKIEEPITTDDAVKMN